MSVTIRDVLEEKLKIAKSSLWHYSKKDAIGIIMNHAENVMECDIGIKFLERTLTLMDKYGDSEGLEKSLKGHENNLASSITRSSSIIKNFHDYIELTTQISLIKELKPLLEKK